MKAVEIRRHSVRERPAEHLSKRGRELAAEVGKTRGPFRVVLSSTSPRAIETAEAMGCPPQAKSALWFDFGEGAIPWPLTFAEYGGQVETNPVARILARKLAGSVREILPRLEEGQQALIVTHGGFPELATTNWSLSPEMVRLGPPCKCMEGVLLRFQEDEYAGADALRVPESSTRL